MKNLKFPFLAFSLALTWGCSNPPEANFTPSLNLAEKGEIIIFDNQSLFHASQSWDFGDGETSTEADPRKAYNSTGEFLAVLTALDKSGNRSDSYSEVIIVGNRFGNYIDVVSLPANNAQGNPWDGAGDPADVQLLMKESSSSTWTHQTPENTNLTNSVPFFWDPSAANVPFTYGTWDFLLLDTDGATSDTMGTWTIDLDTVFTNRFIQLSGSGLDVKVRYQLHL